MRNKTKINKTNQGLNNTEEIKQEAKEIDTLFLLIQTKLQSYNRKEKQKNREIINLYLAQIDEKLDLISANILSLKDKTEYLRKKNQ